MSKGKEIRNIALRFLKILLDKEIKARYNISIKGKGKALSNRERK
jgi:hypothetical protein